MLSNLAVRWIYVFRRRNVARTTSTPISRRAEYKIGKLCNMFEIEVISDPSFALAPNTAMWEADLPALARYDVNLVKPVILFSEKVRLRTFRSDMLSMVDGDAFSYTVMPMRVIHRFLYLSYARDRNEIEFLGIDESTLAPIDKAFELFQQITDKSVSSERGMAAYYETEDRYSEGINKVRFATRRRLRKRRDSLATDELDAAIAQGILSVEGWAVDTADPWSQAWIEDKDFFAAGIDNIMSTHGSNRSSVTMFEPGSQMLFSSGEGESAGILKTQKPGCLEPATLAASMIARLPGLSSVPLDEILEIRDDLRDYLPAFRSAMIDLTDEIADHNDRNPYDVARIIERAWHQKINPALSEMEFKARRNSYPRELLRVFSGDKDALIGTASSIGLVAGSLVAGAITFIPAAIAASVPFVKAFNSRLRKEDKLENNRLFFLYNVQKKISDM
jgi:hypothetical protein